MIKANIQIFSLVSLGYAVNLVILFLSSLMSLTGIVEHRGFSSDVYQISLTFGLVGTFIAIAVKDCFCVNGSFPRLLACSGVCLCVGGCGVFATILPLIPSAVGVLGALLIGVGCAASFAMWHRVLAYGESSEIRKNVIVGTTLASLFSVPLVLLKDPVAWLVLFMIASILNSIVAALVCLGCEFEEKLRRKDPLSIGGPIEMRRLASCVRSMWRPALCTGVIGFASRVLQAFASEMRDGLSMALIVSMLLAALCMALLYRKRSDFPFRLLYGALSIFVTIIFLSLTLVPHSVLPILAASSYFCFSLVSMNMVITTAEMSQLRRIYPSIVFGFFAAFVYTLTDAGPLIVSSLGQLLGLSQIIVASMMVVYLISIAGLLFGFSGSERALGGTGIYLKMRNCHPGISRMPFFGLLLFRRI